MKWLPPPTAFRERLAAVADCGSAQDRLEELARLADAQLTFVETLQLDASLRRIAIGHDSRLETVLLALLGSRTVDHLLPAIRVAGLRRGLHIETYAGTYGQYRQEVMDPAAALPRFRPDTILFSLSARDFVGAVPLDA